MTLTREERKRLAEEARKLAYECAEGTAPTFSVGTFYDAYDDRYCVLGEVARRAGFNARSHDETWNLFYGSDVTRSRHEAAGTAAEANNSAPTRAKRHSAVVFPLLALADEVEAADALDESTP